MFDGCLVLERIFLQFDLVQLTDISYIFKDCRSIRYLEFFGLWFSNITNMFSAFEGCSALETLDTGSTGNIIYIGIQVANTYRMFYGCSNLNATIQMESIEVKDYLELFYGAATKSGSGITVNYTSDTSNLVDSLITTKSGNSNVLKGVLIS